MSVINSSLQALLDQFALTNPSASKTFTDLFNASSSLTDQYNTLASGGYLLGFSGMPSDKGVGGQGPTTDSNNGVRPYI